MKKRIIAIFAAFVTVIVSSVNVSAKKTVEEYFAEMVIPSGIEAYETTPRMAVYTAGDASPVFLKDSDIPAAPASLTKLVTAMVVLDNVSAEDIFTVGSESELVERDSSRCGIKIGQSLTVYGLLCGLLMRSGNDAAYTLAVNVARIASGSELDNVEAVEYFCGMMNEHCRNIGALNSNFATPDGYDAEGQLTTLDDLAVIASKALEYDLIAEITSCPRIDVYTVKNEKFVWGNTNFFLNPAFPLYNPDVRGMKTGSTDDAGKCLITLFTVGGRDYIAIVSGCGTEGERYASAQYLISQTELLHRMSENICSLLGAVE